MVYRIFRVLQKVLLGRDNGYDLFWIANDLLSKPFQVGHVDEQEQIQRRQVQKQKDKRNI